MLRRASGPGAIESTTDKPVTFKPASPAAESVNFRASDRKIVSADLYSVDSDRILLLFHQARSNAKEYQPIVRRLAALGFDCLAVDLRVGGTMWGAKNRTGSASGPYSSAYKDMLGALAWARSRKYRAIGAVGSSYSASLCLRLAGEVKDIRAVAAFSPGEYFPNKRQVKDWNFRCKVPVLMAMTESEKLEGGLTLYQAASDNSARTRGDMMLCFREGVHGASTLRKDKNPSGAKRYWLSFESFLKRHVR